MMILRIYNFCPLGIEIAEIMEKMRIINKGNFKLIRFQEVEEFKSRKEFRLDYKLKKEMAVCGRRKRCFCPDGSIINCKESHITSILTYENKGGGEKRCQD